MNKIIVVCGATATGKTKLANQISNKFDGELLSCDSRQVYRGFNIGTGKDLDLINDKTIWGIDLVDSNQDFSVYQYVLYAREKINDIWKRGHLPVVVGGTGFYIKALIDGMDTIGIPKNDELRNKLKNYTSYQLFDYLEKLDPQRANRLNNSDRNNPFRLIRAIEISSNFKDFEKINNIDADVLWIGLKAEINTLSNLIEKRVDDRFIAGMEREVFNLIKNGVLLDSQAFTSTGYKLWSKYLNKEIDLNELKSKWILQERQYARRQMTWFNKEKRIKWFGFDDLDLVENTNKYINAWYNHANEKE